MKSRARNKPNELLKWVLLALLSASLLLGVVVLIVPLLIPEPKPILPRERPLRPTELVLVPDEEDEEQSGRQIVSIDAPETEEVPEEADFEDRVNRSVEEETVARDRREGRRETTPAPPRPPRPPRERTARAEPEEPQEPEETTPAPTTERERIPREVETPTDDTVARIERDEAEAAMPERSEGEPGPPSTDVLSSFLPTMATASEFIDVPGAAQIDHLDLPQGDRTALNSFENLYWSYWDRIKNQVRPYWQPSTVYRQNDPTGRVYGVEDRYTVLRVTLNGDGSLRHVYLERSSDLDFLDREAIRAIRDAQPFANVPEGLKDERGLLSFRFGFYFEVSSRHFRIRREDWP
jgi:TonB family protein